MKDAICIALTGDSLGDCDEELATVRGHTAAEQEHPSDSDEEDEIGSEGEEQERANRSANKSHPLAHRCLSALEFKHNDLSESVLDRAKEVTVLDRTRRRGGARASTSVSPGWPRAEMANEATAEHLEVVSGHGG